MGLTHIVVLVIVLTALAFIPGVAAVCHAGHSIRIGKISPLKLTLHGLKYTGVLYGGTYHPSFSSETVFVRFHWPTPTLPRWLTFTSQSILYKSETADISCEELFVTFWFFPILFRQTVGPWTNCEIRGLRIRVRRSSQTPYFIKRLRENLVGAIIQGDIYRVDDLGFKVHFSGLTERVVDDMDGSSSLDGEASIEDAPENVRCGVSGKTTADVLFAEEGGFKHVPCKKAPQRQVLPCMTTSQDEMRISSFTRGFHLHNKEGRIYSFGEVNAQLRRNWVSDRGSFVMIAKECRWVRFPWPYQRQKVVSWPLQLFTSVVKFPFDLIFALRYPLTTVNLYVTRLDVQFDDFRIRDAELILQSLRLLREKMRFDDIQWQDVFADMLIKTALAFIRGF